MLDLGETSTFSSLEIYQMMCSAGQITQAELFVSSTDSDTWPTQSDDSWTSITSGPVANGADQTGDRPCTNTSVSTFNFAATTGRYVRLYAQNDGTHDPDTSGYTEAAGAKLFGFAGAAPAPAAETEAATPGATDEALTSTGVNAGAGLGVACTQPYCAELTHRLATALNVAWALKADGRGAAPGRQLYLPVQLIKRMFVSANRSQS